MNPINHSFLLNVEECVLSLGGSVIISLWVSRFSQFLINGPFEKQIGGSTNARKPAAFSSSSILKNDPLN